MFDTWGSLSALFDIKVGADLYSMPVRLIDQVRPKGPLAGRDEWYRSEERASRLPDSLKVRPIKAHDR